MTSGDQQRGERGRKARPIPQEAQLFGGLLALERTRNRLSQAQVAREVGLSDSFLARIERGAANFHGVLSRNQVSRLIKFLRILPPVSDELLIHAGFGPGRTPREEADLHSVFPALQAVWVFGAQTDLDSFWEGQAYDQIWRRGVKYSFFASETSAFTKFVEGLVSDGVWEFHARDAQQIVDAIERCTRCFLLPRQFFTSTYIIYDPGGPGMLCSGSRMLRGVPDWFFTNAAPETERLYLFLKEIAESIESGAQLDCGSIGQVYPDASANSVGLIVRPARRLEMDMLGTYDRDVRDRKEEAEGHDDEPS